MKSFFRVFRPSVRPVDDAAPLNPVSCTLLEEWNDDTFSDATKRDSLKDHFPDPCVYTNEDISAFDRGLQMEKNFVVVEGESSSSADVVDVGPVGVAIAHQLPMPNLAQGGGGRVSTAPPTTHRVLLPPQTTRVVVRRWPPPLLPLR